ncbi:uncharacterized protein C2845_PM13G09870 [Panicum miliaceum]|uniref:Uncharacterized protein n=1 Tax=Panicum miliaceum TaxID=4540 RepID=A0A3L6RGC6_PANMI|nr:uncharacterized protein C2845_PM13G09870 [Panicum miliaceum]
MEGGGESPNGVVIDPVRCAGGEGFYNRDPELNDVVCALCGVGGELLCCEGPCLRSYHGTRDAGHPSGCRSLGFTTAQVQVSPCKFRLCGIFFAGVAQTGNIDVQCAGHGDLQANSMLRCSNVTMTLVAASTTPCALAHSFTPGILQRLPDAESGLPLVGLSGAGDHIVHALLFFTIEDWFHALGLPLNFQTMIVLIVSPLVKIPLLGSM